jgi:hypothetical protein
MFEQNIDYFKFKPVNIPKITVMTDHGYDPKHLTTELEKIYPQIMTKIKLRLLPNSQNKKRLHKESPVLLSFPCVGL